MTLSRDYRSIETGVNFQLPVLHRDPFDRILVSHTIVRGLTILTPLEPPGERGSGLVRGGQAPKGA